MTAPYRPTQHLRTVNLFKYRMRLPLNDISLKIESDLKICCISNITTVMSAKQTNQPTTPIADTDRPADIVNGAIKKVLSSKRGRPRKNQKKSAEVVSESSAEEESAGEASAGEASVASSDDDSDRPESAGYADGSVTTLVVGEYTIDLPVNKKKELLFPAPECQEVADMIFSGEQGVALTRRQLQIADVLGTAVAKAEHVNGERKAPRADKSSFSAHATWSQPFFLELQSQYVQANGNPYTLQAFQEVINHWFFKHINAGNAYSAIKSNLRWSEPSAKSKASPKVIGVVMPTTFWSEDFLGGYLHTDEGKHILQTAEESMASKRKATKNSKATNETTEGRTKNVGDAVKKMSKAEKRALMAMLAESDDDDDE